MAVFFTRRGAPPSLGTRLGDLEIGTIVHIKENGGYQDYLVVHQGIPSSIYDASCNGTWMLRASIDFKMPFGSNKVNTIEKSTVQPWLDGEMLSKYDADIQNVIKQVKIPYVAGAAGNQAETGSNGYPCKIFLLSAKEVGWTQNIQTGFDLPNDGVKLSYFLSGSSYQANNKRKFNSNVSFADYTWLRTPASQDASYSYAGSMYNPNGTVQQRASYFDGGVLPAMILPLDLAVDDNNNILV